MAKPVLSPDILIEMTLQAGAVYYFINTDESFKSKEPHYWVVLNNPSDAETVVVCATSKVGKVQLFAFERNLPPNSIVKVSPGEYSEFKEETIFNCNSPRVYTRVFLEELIAGKKMLKATLPVIPDSILNRLQTGICISPMVESNIQKLVENSISET